MAQLGVVEARVLLVVQVGMLVVVEPDAPITVRLAVVEPRGLLGTGRRGRAQLGVLVVEVGMVVVQLGVLVVIEVGMLGAERPRPPW